MMHEAMIQKISELPDEYYERLSEYVDALIREARQRRESELDEAIEQSKADIAAGRFTCNLQEHLKELGCA